MNDTTEPAARKPSAIDFKIKDLVRNARYFKAVADGNGDKTSLEYQAHTEQLVALTIGAAIGNGELYRKRESAADAAPADQMKALRDDARWIAAAAAQNLGIEKNSDRYATLAESIVDAAISTAVAGGRLKAPQRSFAEKVTESRSNGQSEGQSL